MSDYKRGKANVADWVDHWNRVADFADSRTTIEGKMSEYGQAIRVAFTNAHVPDILATTMRPHVRVTHRVIMGLPVDQRESLIVWAFGDDDEVITLFGRKDREPSKIKPIYQKIGRKFRR